MINTYSLTENESEDLLFCETCGTYLDDYAELDTLHRRVKIKISSCFGDTYEVYTLRGFLEAYEDNILWPEEPFNTLVNDVKELR